MVEINALELELHVLLSQQLEALLSRRRQRVREQAGVSGESPPPTTCSHLSDAVSLTSMF